MDRLALEARQERVNKLVGTLSQDVLAEFEEYGGVLRMLWEKEFRALALRVVEIAAKLPHERVRISFVQEIIAEMLLPFSSHDIAGMMESLVQDAFMKRRMVQVMEFDMSQFMATRDDRRGRPGVA